MGALEGLMAKDGILHVGEKMLYVKKVSGLVVLIDDVEATSERAAGPSGINFRPRNRGIMIQNPQFKLTSAIRISL